MLTKHLSPHFEVFLNKLLYKSARLHVTEIIPILGELQSTVEGFDVVWKFSLRIRIYQYMCGYNKWNSGGRGKMYDPRSRSDLL